MAIFDGNILTGNEDFHTNDIINFDYSGSAKSITLKAGEYLFECWGAMGGTDNYRYNGGPTKLGGKGAYTKGKIKIKDTTLHIYVGQASGINNKAGTFNGGGKGSPNYSGVSGGGASDIRLISGNWSDLTSLRSRITVAAAGGGASVWGTCFR